LNKKITYTYLLHAFFGDAATYRPNIATFFIPNLYITHSAVLGTLWPTLTVFQCSGMAGRSSRDYWGSGRCSRRFELRLLQTVQQLVGVRRTVAT